MPAQTDTLPPASPVPPVRNDGAHRLVIPLLVATLWHAVVTTLLGIGRHHVERHCARGTAGAR